MRMEQTYPQIRWWIVLTLVLGAFVLCFGGPVAAESEQAGVTILAVRHEGRILVGPEGSAWKDMGPGRSVSIEPHGIKAAYCSAHDDGPQELFIHSLVSNQRELVYRAVDVTVIDAAWTPDGNTLYFSRYPDRHAGEPNPFRVYRIDRDGRNMRESGRGEKISVGCKYGAQ